MTAVYPHAAATFCQHAAVCEPDDDVEYDVPQAIWCDSSGKVNVIPHLCIEPVQFTMPVHAFVPVMVRRVLKTGTTAGKLVRMW